MDFTLTDEQEMVRDTARTLLAKECPPTLVRASIDDRSISDELWRRHLREWAVLGDGDLVDHAFFLEEAGRVMLPGPYFSTAALFLPLLRAVGHPLADAAAAGEVTGTVAMANRAGEWVVHDEPLRTFVVDGDRVDHLAIVLSGPALAVVPAAETAVHVVESLDLVRRYVNVEVPAGLATDRLSIDASALRAVLDRATVALAAEMVGVSGWLLDSSVGYAKERVQFDRPIGSFQGLQWKLVGMAQDHERAAAAVAYAAMAVDADDPDRVRATHVAKAAAGRAVRVGAQDGMQVHGGIGYTWEHDLHLYVRRAVASNALLGTADWHHDRLADLLLDTVGSTAGVRPPPRPRR
jgi:alkylation response protein AidB-like acyl-CoA dehydrogenase